MSAAPTNDRSCARPPAEVLQTGRQRAPFDQGSRGKRSTGGMLSLAFGGRSNPAGIDFDVNDERWRHENGVRNRFVVGGFASQFTAVLFYV